MIFFCVFPLWDKAGFSEILIPGLSILTWIRPKQQPSRGLLRGGSLPVPVENQTYGTSNQTIVRRQTRPVTFPSNRSEFQSASCQQSRLTANTLPRFCPHAANLCSTITNQRENYYRDNAAFLYLDAPLLPFRFIPGKVGFSLWWRTKTFKKVQPI